MPLDEFVTGRKETCRLDQELLTHVTLDRPGPRTGEVYLKLGRRGAMEVALVGVAARISFSEAGTIDDARFAVCAVGPKAFRVSAEKLLVGTRGEDDVTQELVASAEAQAQPIDDVRSSADYRRRVLGHLIRQAIAACRERAAA
jgi:carbon-monoxide dehydrogenase medium subunit